MAIFVATSPPTGGVNVPSFSAWVPALAVIAGLTALSAFAALRSRGTARVIWLAAATAVMYALVNAVTKGSVGIRRRRTRPPTRLPSAGVTAEICAAHRQVG